MGSPRARDAAFARGAAPITLIDGEVLLDLLIEHGIGVRTRKIELLDLKSEDLVPAADAADPNATRRAGRHHRPPFPMPDLSTLASVAETLRADVARSASGAKRLKLRTLLGKFGYAKRSDANTAEITRLLTETGLTLNPPIVRFGEN